MDHKTYLEMFRKFNNLLYDHKINRDEYIKPISDKLISYSVDDIVEGKNYIDILICPICYNILKDPISCNSKEKSHSFCELCILKSLKINDKCPMCKQTFEYSTNNKTKELLKKLKFKCKYSEEGCKQILNYSYYFRHLEICTFKETLYECQVEKYNYSKKILLKCGYIGTIKDLIKHFKKCALLKYKCPFCNNNFLLIKIREHFSSYCKILIEFRESSTYIGYHDNNFNKNGFGKLYLPNGSRYEGEFKNGEANGFGMRFEDEEILYQGQFKNGRANGFGIQFSGGEVVYQGQFKNGRPNGIGIQFNADNIYQGEIKNDYSDGFGICLFEDDNWKKYEGEWKNGLFNGYGILYFQDGSIYHGIFKNDKINGFGISYIKNEGYYIGQHKDNKYHGYGKAYYLDTKIEIKGKFKHGDLNGFGIKFFPNGDIIEGYWKYGFLNGICFLYKANGEKYIKLYEDDEEIFSKKIC